MPKQLTGLCVLAAVLTTLLTGCDDSDGSSGSMSSQASGTAMPHASITSDGGPVRGRLTIGSATLSWDAPTSNTNGSALTDLSGYRIYYGTSAAEMSESVQISNVGLQTYVIENLEPGTWYFAIRAVTSAGSESALSDIVSKTIG